MSRSLVFPIARVPLLDKLILRAIAARDQPGPAGEISRRAFRSARILCNVCGRVARVQVLHGVLRETVVCAVCGSFNRQRQLAWVICSGLGMPGHFPSLAQLAQRSDLAIYNTETSRAIHETLRGMVGYQCSEYLDPELPSGAEVNGIVHQDLQCLTYPDESFDLVLSTEVLEHVPDPYRAHREIFRVLRPGGRHVFTVPFNSTDCLDQVRARIAEDGTLIHLLEPQYHGDTLRAEGALAYTVFALEMLVRLGEIGFRTRMYHLYKPWLGIVGFDAFVFEGVKPLRKASGAPTISASPNPLLPGSTSTTISWDTGDGSVGQVWVSRDGGSETLFGSAPSGHFTVSWIEPGVTFQFKLYAGTSHTTELASTSVT